MTSVQIKARPAKPLDAVNLMRLLEEGLLTENEEGLFPPPEYPRLLNWVTNVIHNGYAVVIEKSGRIVGSLALMPIQLPWAEQWVLNMEWFYVKKRFRGNAADALLIAAHAMADSRGATIVGGVSSGRNTALKDRLMKMKGYIYLGGQFIRRPADG